MPGQGDVMRLRRHLPKFTIEPVGTACTHNPTSEQVCGEADFHRAWAEFSSAVTRGFGVLVPATPESAERF